LIDLHALGFGEERARVRDATELVQRVGAGGALAHPLELIAARVGVDDRISRAHLGRRELAERDVELAEVAPGNRRVRPAFLRGIAFESLLHRCDRFPQATKRAQGKPRCRNQRGLVGISELGLRTSPALLEEVRKA